MQLKAYFLNYVSKLLPSIAFYGTQFKIQNFEIY